MPIHNFLDQPDVKFVAGRTFQSEYGTHEAGTEVEEARLFPNLDVLVSAGFLYPYSPEDGYSYLPPHLFSSVNTYEEVIAKLRGDHQSVGGQVEQFPYGKPDEVLEAERQAEVQEASYPLILRAAAENQRRAVDEAEEQMKANPVPESSKATPVRRPVERSAVKKTAAPRKKDESNG